MDLQKTFGTNPQLEQEGRWFNLGDGRIKIARTNNPKYRELLRAKTKPLRQSLRQDLLENDELDPILIEVMAKTIILGWENINEDGKPLAYSAEAAQAMLTKYKDFRDWVAANADNMQAFKTESAVASLGNLPVE